MIDNARFGLLVNKERAAVALVLLLFVSLAAIYSIVTPIFEGYDENWHFGYVQYIASGRGLPRQPPEQTDHLARQEASQPPLYYLLVAATVGWMADDDFATHLWWNPQFAPVPWGYRDNQNIIIHTDAERFPYRGTTLALHLARGLSVLLGAGTVYCTYVLARLLFPGQAVLAVGAMIVAALTPGFVFTSALVNNDVLIALLSSIALVLMVKLYADPTRWPVVVALGVVLGCAALTKLSGLLLWALAGLMLVVSAWRRRAPGRLARAGITVFSLAVLVSGWWYVRNWMLYGDPTGVNMMLDIVGRRPAGFGLQDALAELEGVRWSYWALFGWFNVPVAGWLYRIYDLLTVAALVGLLFLAVQRVRARRWRDLSAMAFLALWLLASLAGLVRWTLLTTGSQGRLLYPAIGAISILLVGGWLALVPRQEQAKQWAIGGMGVAFLGVAVYVPFFVIAPVYARPAFLSSEQVRSRISQQQNVYFEDQVVMIGTEVDRQEIQPGELLWVTVCWRGEKKIEEDYTVFVQLLVDGDLIAAQKDTYPGLGSFPTSLWPEGVMFCDPYPLRVADTVPSPGPANLSLGLYRRDGERLPAYSAGRQPLGDNVRLPGPRVVFAEGQRAIDYDWGHQIALVDYQLDRTTLAPGESLTLSLVWRALRRMPTDYVATVQVMDEHGTKIGQSDIPLLTSAWQPDTIMTDRRSIPISRDAVAGVYNIQVGVYEPVTIQNLVLYRKRQVLPGGGLLALWKLRILSGQS
jgi:4-amino-4-deoxy-L-arabinose transferase-like glycosyltransferase